MKIIYKTLTLFVILITISMSLFAQNETIDVTKEHAKLGKEFATKVWKETKSGGISLPETVEYESDGADQIVKIVFEEPIDIITFTATVDKLVEKDSSITTRVKKWRSIKAEEVFKYFILRGNSEYTATYSIKYNVRSGVASFRTSSIKL